MQLRVQRLQQSDAERGLAAIDRQSAEEIGVEPGEFVLIEGSSQTVGKVWPGYEQDTGNTTIRIDNELRSEAEVRVGEIVNVEKVEPEPASEIKIAVPDNLHGNVEEHIRRELHGRAVMEGQNIHYSQGMGFIELFTGTGAQKVPVKIVSTNPDSPVVVTEQTKVIKVSSGVRGASVPGGDANGSTDGHIPVAYEDVGGLDEELEQVREMIELPMRYPELFQQLGVAPPKGVLLHGPPGTGKTLLSRAIANETAANFETISGPEIMSKYYGESEEQLREVFERAEKNSPSIIFIDEIDSIAPKRGEATGDVERRVVAQLLSLMDGLEQRGEVMVIGATNRLDAIDPALRRGGRFDREIEVGVPDKEGREEILHVHTRNMPLSDDVDIEEYADNTHGFVGADLEELAKEAAMNSLRRVRPELDLEEGDVIDVEILDSLEVTNEDFKQSLRGIEPSALREVFVEVPEVTWDDVGGLEGTKETLRETVQWPLKYPEAFEKMDMDAAKGVLLYGPPGTGKTLMAKAIANESDSNFISVKGPELLSKWVGESEKGVREMFQKARENAPSVIFFDEIDSIAGERGSSEGNQVTERVVSQLLTELDGLEKLEDVVVIATTNRPDLIDSALIRPGRLDRHIHVPTPDEEARKRIFEVHTRNKPLADDVDVEELARMTDGYVGADIESVTREASLAATREYLTSLENEDDYVGGLDDVTVEMKHFREAIESTTPSVTDQVREKYEEIEQEFETGASSISSERRSFQ